MSKTMVEAYTDLTKDNYEMWLGKKGKKSGTSGVNSALDERENRAMYNAYVAEIDAQNAYGRKQAYLDESKAAALDANEKKRATAMRENAVMTERAKEYAQRRAALSGFSNSGMSQTAMIDLYAQMAGNRANTAAAYDAQENSIIQEYQRALLEAEGTRDAAIATAQGNANAIAAEVGVERATQADTLRQSRVTDVQNALADYEAGNIDFDKVTEIYGKNEGILSPDADRDIIDEYKSLLAQRDEEESFVNNNNFGVSDVSDAVNTSNLTLEELNKYLDVDGAGDGDEQDRWVSEVLSKIAKGQIEDGTIIDMNYGSIAGHNKGNYFIYKNGKLYRTGLTYFLVNAALESKGNSGKANDDYIGDIELFGEKRKFMRKDG